MILYTHVKLLISSHLELLGTLSDELKDKLVTLTAEINALKTELSVMRNDLKAILQLTGGRVENGFTKQGSPWKAKFQDQPFCSNYTCVHNVNYNFAPQWYPMSCDDIRGAFGTAPFPQGYYRMQTGSGRDDWEYEHCYP